MRGLPKLFVLLFLPSLRTVVEHANWSRAWMAELPREVAEKIAYRNADALFGGMLKP